MPNQKQFSWTQFFPGKPKYTEANIPADLHGKVYLVTGANTGMGKDLARLLYARRAKVYAASRSEERGRQAIADIQQSTKSDGGELVFLQLDLADLDKTAAAAREFLARESRLHVLFNNAGVMVGPVEPPLKTAQGYELAMGVNCVATHLLTRLLTPALVAAARSEPASTVRVVWLSSFAMEQFAPDGLGVDMGNLDYREPRWHMERYGISKAGDWLLGVEFARRLKGEGIVSVAVNPGNLRTDLARDVGIVLKVVAWLISYPTMYGVYTELFAAFSPNCSLEKFDYTKQWGAYLHETVWSWGANMNDSHPMGPGRAAST